jgi:hypothetical protein
MPKGMSELPDGHAYLNRPASGRGEYWTLVYMWDGGVEFSAQGANNYSKCGTVAYVLMESKGRSQMSVTWEDAANDVMGAAIMSHG